MIDDQNASVEGAEATAPDDVALPTAAPVERFDDALATSAVRGLVERYGAARVIDNVRVVAREMGVELS